jgi:hypothetical protein
LIKGAALGLPHEGTLFCDRWYLHDDTINDLLYIQIISYEIWPIWLLVIVLESQDLSAMHPACCFENIVAIFSPARRRFDTV